MKKKSATNASNKALLSQNYVSAGANNAFMNPSSAGGAVMIGSAGDHHSFDKRPNSQMNSYQKKVVTKNSMIAVANKKKKDIIMGGMGAGNGGMNTYSS